MGRKKQVEEETDPEEFYVEVIKAARMVAADSDAETRSPKKKKKKKGKSKEEDPPATPNSKEYYVKVRMNTFTILWEPAANLESCRELIDRFWNAIGSREEDSQIGIELVAPEHWIEQEAARFRREHEREKEEKRKKQEEKQRRKREREVVKKEKELKKRESSQVSTSALKLKINKKRQRIESSDSEEEEDSDTPLAKRRMKQERTPSRVSTQTPSQPSRRPTSAEPKSKRRKIMEESASSLPPAIARGSSPDSLFGGRGSPMETSANSDGSATSHPPVPVPVQVPVVAAAPVSNPSPPTVVPKPPPLPNRKTALAPVRRGGGTDPLSKLPSVSQELGPSGSGISTKVRLAQGALAPVLPRKTSSAVLNKPEPVKTGSSTIMATNFRRSGGIPAALHHHEPTLASLNAAPGSPLTEPTFDGLTDRPEVDSPVAMEPVEDPFTIRPSPTMAAADEFLNSIMPPEMAGPMVPAPDTPVEPAPLHPLPAKAPPLPSRKTFRWEGSLAVTAGESVIDVPEIEFPIIMEDELDYQLQGLRFSFFFKPTGLEKLQVERLYDVHELSSVIPSFSTPSHFSRISVQSCAPDKKKQWALFLRFLQKSKKVMLFPLKLDKEIIAYLLLAPLTPSASGIEIPSRLKPYIKPTDNLVGCILASTLTPKQAEGEWRPKLAQVQEISASIVEKCDPFFKSEFKSRPLFQQAMRVLDFPVKIYDYLKQTNRSWAIYPPLDNNSKAYYEVEMLRAILADLRERAAHQQRKNPANKARYPMMREASKPSTAGVLFIHVGVLRHLRRLQFLRERLLAPDYVRFYTFGSHPSVYRKSWGVREVFPCGGIVTFLPSVFLKYPLEMMGIIRKIEEHPFWAAYILPSVLGMVLKQSGADANARKWAYSYLLQAIEDGHLALIEAPPDTKFCFGEPSNDHRTRWFHDYLAGIAPSQEEAWAFASDAFSSVTANIPQSDWATAIEEEVAQDLTRMQNAAKSHGLTIGGSLCLTGMPVSKQDTLEWLSPDHFSFRDSFLPN
ncbi:hypothetical protein NMY22_g11857 [Coprinellus aureogranulatus]|nr:hypothetical protein NMY22_g11857 [Coprinellus aureogranulatus]